jgi:hypothetical protein
MANPLSGVGAVQHLSQATPTTPTQQAQQATKNQAVAPQDSVNISKAGKAASQSQASGDRDHDGDSK